VSLRPAVEGDDLKVWRAHSRSPASGLLGLHTNRLRARTTPESTALGAIRSSTVKNQLDTERLERPGGNPDASYARDARRLLQTLEAPGLRHASRSISLPILWPRQGATYTPTACPDPPDSLRRRGPWVRWISRSARPRKCIGRPRSGPVRIPGSSRSHFSAQWQ
jgi:hypothetical protein